MAKAGDNEDRLKKILSKQGKCILKEKLNFRSNNCSISVDANFTYNQKTYLVEVDSYNMAKVVVGQYVLLNELFDENKARNQKDNCVFLVVHCYKGYEVGRTEKYLQLVNDNIYLGKGVPFKVLHIDQIQCVDDFYDKL